MERGGGGGGGGTLYLLQLVVKYARDWWLRCQRRRGRRLAKAAVKTQIGKVVQYKKEGIMSGSPAAPEDVERRQNGKLRRRNKEQGDGRSDNPTLGTYMQGMSTRDSPRCFAAAVELVFHDEDFSEAVNTVLVLRNFVSELHVVMATVAVREANLASIAGLFPGADELQGQLNAEGIRVIVHPNRNFNPKLISHDVYRLVYIPSVCSMSLDVWRQMTAAMAVDYNAARNWNAPQNHNKIYSIRAHADEASWTLWTPMIIALLIFDWWRAFGTQWWRTLNRRDVLIYPVHQCDQGTYIPAERRFLGIIPGTGGTGDRARYMHVDTGCINMIPDDWSGWQRFQWIAKHSDPLGPGSVFFLWVLVLVALLGFPYWNLLIWLEFDMFLSLRIPLWILHSMLMVMVLQRFLSTPWQNLFILFATPFMYLPLMPVFLYARYWSVVRSPFRDEARNRRAKRARNAVPPTHASDDE